MGISTPTIGLMTIPYYMEIYCRELIDPIAHVMTGFDWCELKGEMNRAIGVCKIPS